MDIVAKIRAACRRGGIFAGKWALIGFAGVAAFALAVQALALVLAALALLVIALCLATVCMPEESRAVWAWMRETLYRWSAVAGSGAAEADSAESGTAEAGTTASGTTASARADKGTTKSVEPECSGPKSEACTDKRP